MATPVTRYWTGSIDTLWSNPSNWDEVPGGTGAPGLPTDIDNVVFNGTGVVNCRMDTPIHVASFDCQAAYTGSLDAATDGLNHYVSGNCSLTGGGSTLMGASQWTVDGDFDNDNAVGWSYGTSLVRLRGTSNTLRSDSSRDFYNLTITEGATITIATASSTPQFRNVCAIHGNLIIPSGETLGAQNYPSTLELYSTGSLTGNGTVSLGYGGSLGLCDGLFNPGTLILSHGGALSTFVPGSGWYCDVQILNSSGNRTFTFVGDYLIHGDLLISSSGGAGTTTINNSLNNPSFTLHGDFEVVETAGTIAYTKGTGIITAAGVNQEFDLNDLTIEDLSIQSTGLVEFLSGWTADSFSATSGTLDFGAGVLSFETVGDWSIDGAQVDGGSLDNVEWVVGGNLYLYGDPLQNGTLMDLVATGAWEITLTGVAFIEKVDVAYCDMGVGSATAYYSKDSGNNTGWTFAYNATARTMDELMVLLAPNQVKAISSQDLRDFLLSTGLSPKVKHTDIGGLAVKMTNRTGAVSEAGRLVEASSSYDSAVDIVAANGVDCIGAFLDSGVADGSEAWIVIAGICDVLLEDNTGTTRDYWVKVSDTEAGYADGTNSAPPGGTITNIQDHFSEIGHALQNISAGGVGTHQLARIILHFN